MTRLVLTNASVLDGDMPARADRVVVIGGDRIAGVGDAPPPDLTATDTPETEHPTKGVECFGPEASEFTKRRLTGRVVRLESDVERRDVYDRRLAYVYLHGHRFNDELLRRGYARFLVIPPNDRRGRVLLAAELDARRRARGLWGECE